MAPVTWPRAAEEKVAICGNSNATMASSFSANLEWRETFITSPFPARLWAKIAGSPVAESPRAKIKLSAETSA